MLEEGGGFVHAAIQVHGYRTCGGSAGGGWVDTPPPPRFSGLAGRQTDTGA